MQNSKDLLLCFVEHWLIAALFASIFLASGLWFGHNPGFLDTSHHSSLWQPCTMMEFNFLFMDLAIT